MTTTGKQIHRLWGPFFMYSARIYDSEVLLKIFEYTMISPPSMTNVGHVVDHTISTNVLIKDKGTLVVGMNDADKEVVVDKAAESEQVEEVAEAAKDMSAVASMELVMVVAEDKGIHSIK